MTTHELHKRDGKRTIALVVPGFSLGGGVTSVATFLYRAILESEHYIADIVSLTMANNDATSVRLLSPTSWMRGINIGEGSWKGIPYRHVGALFSELETQRYMPRRLLTELLNQYDLVQVVSGGPAIAFTVKDVQKPKCLFAATTVRAERTSLLLATKGLKRLWLYWMTRMTALVESRAVSHVDHIFAESMYTLRILSSISPAISISLAVPGIDIDQFTPAECYSSSGHILSVGRLADPRKNVRMLILAYHLLRQTHPDAPKLMLVGKSPPATDNLNLLMSLGLTDHIEIRHNVSNDELADLYRTASMFALSSNEEGLGVVLLEAMASGLPVVSTRCGGPETIVSQGETGYLVPLGDIQGFAAAMRSILEDEPRSRRMGSRARELAEKRYSIQAAGKAYLDRYNVLLDYPRSRRNGGQHLGQKISARGER